MGRHLPVVLALAIGSLGALLAVFASFPAPWLTGPALFVTIASLSGLRLVVPNILRNGCFVIIGMTIGSGVTPEMLSDAAQWPLSIIVLLLAMLAILALGALLLERGFGYDRTTALLGAAPGHLSFVLSLSTAMKVDVPAVSIIQSTRVLVLTLAVPFLAMAITGADLHQVLPQGPQMTPVVLVLTLLASVGIAAVLERFGLPAAYLLGGMAASSIGHVTETGPGLLPLWFCMPAFVIMGTLIGTRFSGVKLALVRKAAGAALAFTALSAVVAVAAGGAVSVVLDVPLIQTLVAFAPGGLEAMAAMALLLGVNPAFVATHHLLRLLFLTVVIPLSVRSAAPAPSEGSKR